MPPSQMLTRLRLPLLGFSAMALASCAVPPREAWNQIQDKGLITYYLNRSSGAPLTVTPRQMVAQKSTTTGSAKRQAGSQLSAANFPVAQPAKGLAGYVRSPYTTPARLIDVRGLSAGAKVVCPYTQKPFLVPAGMKEPSVAPRVAAVSPKASPTPRQPQARTQPLFKAPTSSAPSKVAAISPPPEPKLEAAPAPKPPAPPQSTSAELPYGTAISGRAGFVHSPYAAKHQLVDVSGLPVGMEVRCPYTGKLFRVPPQ